MAPLGTNVKGRTVENDVFSGFDTYEVIASFQSN